MLGIGHFLVLHIYIYTYKYASTYAPQPCNPQHFLPFYNLEAFVRLQEPPQVHEKSPFISLKEKLHYVLNQAERPHIFLEIFSPTCPACQSLASWPLMVHARWYQVGMVRLVVGEGAPKRGQDWKE